MAQAQANGITLEYEISGPQGAPVLLMIHGVGAQLIRWPPRLCQALEAAGFRLLRFDNRDIGLSAKMDGAPMPDMAAVIAAQRRGEVPALPYTLSDMAADAAGLLDALGIAEAHVMGVSLGGMVAQVMAIEHPARVRSVAILMSQSGNPDAPGSQPQALDMLAKIAPDPALDREAFLAHQVRLNRELGSPLYPAPEAELRRFAALAADRSYYPPGPGRQFAAARGAPDRRAALRRLEIPALVIHGQDDPLIDVACGQDIADAIPGAWFLRVGGMGHDLPDELTALFASAIAANAARCQAAVQLAL